MYDLVLCCNSSIIESLKVIYCYYLSLHPFMIISQGPEALYWAPTFPTCLENTLHSALHTSTLLISLCYTWGITNLCHKEEPQFLAGNDLPSGDDEMSEFWVLWSSHSNSDSVKPVLLTTSWFSQKREMKQWRRHICSYSVWAANEWCMTFIKPKV